MKEKLKKIITNKSLWEYIVGLIALLIFIFGFYIKGFTDGLLIDDEIRTEVIDRVIEETKKDKIEIDINKKEVTSTNGMIPTRKGDSDYTIRWYNFIMYGMQNSANRRQLAKDIYNLNGRAVYFLFAEYMPNFILSNGTTTNFFKFYFIAYGVGDLTTTETTSTNCLLQQVNFTTDDFITFNTYGSNVLGIWGSAGNTPTQNWYAQDLNLVYNYDINIDFINMVGINYQTYFATESFRYALLDFMAEGYKLTADKIEGYTYNDIETARGEGFMDGYHQGYEDRKNSVEESETIINFIWRIIENGVSSVLEVLNIQILPGIPLYICIVVPILLGVLLWVIKLGAQ